MESVRNVEGKPEPNSKLKIFIPSSGASGMKFSPTVLKAEPQKELRWLGSLLICGLFDGEYLDSANPF